MSNSQEINTVECNKDVYKYGVLVHQLDTTKEQATAFCKQQTEETGCRHDWHYFGGWVFVKAIPAHIEELLAVNKKQQSELNLLQTQAISDAARIAELESQLYNTTLAYKELDKEHSRLRQYADEINIDASERGYWAWQDSDNYLESLTCPVLIPAATLRSLLPKALGKVEKPTLLPLRKHVGTATTEVGEVAFSSTLTLSPIVEHPDGRIWTISWTELIGMALKQFKTKAEEDL